MTEYLHDLHRYLQNAGTERYSYTRKAFLMLPKMNHPRILDIGCGTGGPTMELAKVSDGEVTAVDIDLGSLEELQRKADQEGLSDRIRIRLSTLIDLKFPEGYFDILWSEGSIFVIGFEQGLVQWKPFLKQEGFLVIHEMVWLKPEPPEEIRTYWENIYPGICDINSCLNTIATSGYRLIGHFPLPEDLWWREYYEPLQMHICELRQQYAENTAILKMLDKEQHEIDLYRKYQSWYGSAFFVIQKHASTP